VNLRRTALLAALGLAPILLAVAIAAADISRGNLTTVASVSAVYTGEAQGRQVVVALVPAASLPRLRVGQSADVSVANLGVRLSGHVTAVPAGDGTPPPGLDPSWVAAQTPAGRASLAPVVVTLDAIDARLAPGTTVGVRISVADG
jgi:hypothetical protein